MGSLRATYHLSVKTTAMCATIDEYLSPLYIILPPKPGFHKTNLDHDNDKF